MTWEPSFLAGAAGQLFSLYFPPRLQLSEPKGVVYLPPFAEEMNQSRRMVTLQARELSKAGVGVLLLNVAGEVFVAQRIDTVAEAWQMPQLSLIHI